MSQTMIELNDEIRDYFSSIEGLRKVYLQPPSSEKLIYPCLIITQDVPSALYSDDTPYLVWPTYELTLIDPDMESSIPAEIVRKSIGNYYIRFGRYFVADNLCHWSYTLVFTKSIV